MAKTFVSTFSLKSRESNSMITIANCNSEVKLISHVTGTCALFNVKLHFYIYGPLVKKTPFRFLKDCKLCHFQTFEGQCLYIFTPHVTL